jgi:hypothetical protein
VATHIQHEIGNLTRPTATDDWRSRPTAVGVTSTRSMRTDLPPKLEAPQHYPSDMGIFEPARMAREMGRETPQSSRRSQKPGIMSALLNMSNRRFFVLVAGVALLVGGLLALRFPVFLPEFDQWGFQINCGSGFQSALTQAGIVDSSGTHFVDQCRTAITMRRAWAFPLAVAGAVLLGALMVRPPSTRLGAVLPELPGGADDATVFDGATTPTNNASDSRTRSARNVIQSAPASAA